MIGKGFTNDSNLTFRRADESVVWHGTFGEVRDLFDPQGISLSEFCSRLNKAPIPELSKEHRDVGFGIARMLLHHGYIDAGGPHERQLMWKDEE